MSAVDLDAPEHALCSEALAAASRMTWQLRSQLAAAEAERDRLKAALTSVRHEGWTFCGDDEPPYASCAYCGARLGAQACSEDCEIHVLLGAGPCGDRCRYPEPAPPDDGEAGLVPPKAG